MPCVKSDGTLSQVGIAIITAVREPAHMEEISTASGLPLFRARSALRGLVKEGLVERDGDRYVATSAGKDKLKR